MYRNCEKEDSKAKRVGQRLEIDAQSFRVNFPQNDLDNICPVASKCSHLSHHREVSRTKSNNSLYTASDNQESARADTSASENNENMVISFFKVGGRGRVGYLSLCMLIIFTLSNLAIDFVDAQLHRIDSPLLYDTFSTEVLSPPFRYTKFSVAEKQRMGLGSAAISSVTEALSPILPFTGGVDLRREEHWDTTDGWFNAAKSLVDQVRDAFGLEQVRHPWNIPRGGAHFSTTAKTKEQIILNKKKLNRAATLSDPKPFISIDSIKQMTLRDLTVAFRYVMESGYSNFSNSNFLHKINSRMKPIMIAMQKSIEKSRGDGVAAALRSSLTSKSTAVYGDFDALKFCAAMRLFAEWRVVRQVPDGYKGYAVGMNLGQKDIVQNVAKIEKAVHEWIDHQQNQIFLRSVDSSDAGAISNESTDNTLRSPTLRQLLEYEVEMDIHGNQRLPRLKDKTAGMGLLWVRRQLQYQTALFSNVLEVSKSFETSNEAISAAYREVYGKFHGWAVQKIFNYSFQAAPEPEVIFKFMNQEYLKEVSQKAKTMKVSNKFASSTDRADGKPEENFNIFQTLGRRIAEEWNKICNMPPQNGDNSRMAAQTEIDYAEIEDYITREMKKNAHNHISDYLGSIEPLLDDLTGLFKEMNMDDPTKV